MLRNRVKRQAFRPGRRRKSKAGMLLSIVFIALVALAALYFIIPNWQHAQPEWKSMKKPIFVQGEVMKYSASGTGDSLKLPLPVIQQEIDPNIRYEKKTESVIITTSKELVHLTIDHKDAKLNNKPIKLLFAPVTEKGIQYLPISLLKQIYGIEWTEDKSTGAVIVFKAGEEIQSAKVSGGSSSDTVSLRERDSIHSPILQDMTPGTAVRVIRNEGDWTIVQMNNGYVGYVSMKNLTLTDTRKVPEVKGIPNIARQKWNSKKVNLTWEAVYQKQPDPSTIGNLPGINVVSPTWFQIMDGSGNVQSKADDLYVKWAHKNNMQVWALFSNAFDAERTTKALSTFDNRLRAIIQILHYAKLYQLDGINIDFENVYTKDGDNVTQFVRELMPLAKEQGLVISIDVTPKSNSEMWSLFLDRKALGEMVDYMMLMAYDEHWAASPVAGSVASLPWTRASVERLLTEDEVPPDKLILSVPLYTRVWSEETKDGKTTVSSKAIGMKKAQDIVKAFSLTPTLDESTGQNYVEYTENGILKKIWLEDSFSIKQRVELAAELNLAGVASWTRGFASSEAWEGLKEILK
ncbi:glycosyl hydrolase family 18 protein [Paenibacillus sp. SN-8-1]|uniref:glycosyl hydrolase family 18 protein n=1 Tax=Paenibacillus sp. SN-8-1 TaxID=3435409 RepID=UPI003D9A7228